QLLYQSDNFTTLFCLLPSSAVRLLRNPTALTACSRRLSAILTALPFTPSNQNPSRILHAQREKYSHSVVSLRHRSGDAIYPLKRGLFPRHLRAEKARFFVHARILDGSSRHAGRKGKKSFKKIVQICALLCKPNGVLIYRKIEPMYTTLLINTSLTVM
ncbi:hypothetical protein, partial [Escherichia coli]|uniref:hypothetical protein n=2 Tax=Escherichia coli TaxID=562 RepID=UPI0019553534